MATDNIIQSSLTQDYSKTIHNMLKQAILDNDCDSFENLFYNENLDDDHILCGEDIFKEKYYFEIEGELLSPLELAYRKGNIAIIETCIASEPVELDEPLLWYLVKINDFDTFSIFGEDLCTNMKYIHFVDIIAKYGHTEFIQWIVGLMNYLRNFHDIVELASKLIKHHPEKLNIVFETILDINPDKSEYYIDEQLCDLLKDIISKCSTDDSKGIKLNDHILDILQKHHVL